MGRDFLYIHGFNSSPASFKARAFRQWCKETQPEVTVHIPELSHDPDEAMTALESLCRDREIRLILGSSLGGYYATWLSEKYNVAAALINPAVRPWQHLDAQFLGLHTNYYSGKQYEIGPGHVAALSRFEVPELSRPEHLLLLVQTGDEVLDYRLAIDKYRNCTQWVEQGGNHAFEDFESRLPQILQWYSGLSR